MMGQEPSDFKFQLVPRVKNGPIIHTKTQHTGNSGSSQLVDSWWNQCDYSMYNIMGFMERIVEDLGQGVKCPASGIREKLITRYR